MTMTKFLQAITSPRIQGQLRHVVSMIGAVLAVYGYADTERFAAVSGMVLALAGLMASWHAPEKDELRGAFRETPTGGDER